MEPEESGSLTSDYTIKLQQSKQYGTGTKTDIESPEINPCTYGQKKNPKPKMRILS